MADLAAGLPAARRGLAARLDFDRDPAPLSRETAEGDHDSFAHPLMRPSRFCEGTMTAAGTQLEDRIDRLHAPGLVDLHFDLLMDLYEKRGRANVLATEFLPEFEAGNIGVLGAAIYIEDRYLPEMALRVALDQIARLYAEVELSDRFAICKSFPEILRAREAGKIALLITMEGVEPLGADLNLLRVFFELGVRVIGLTHARRNAAGSGGGIFAASGSLARRVDRLRARPGASL